MHQKTKQNTKLFTRIRYFSYSIPLACIMACACSLVIFPNQNKTYAIECNPEILGDDMDEYTYDNTVCAYKPKLTPTENVTISSSTTPTASLSIDGKTSVEDKINSSYGATNYASHTVSVNVTGAESYELILSGPAKLSGPSVINATAGATGTNLANDTWGYAWENTRVSNANANYKALGSNIKLAGDALNNQAASFSKKLAFAVKFSEKSNAGAYHADISLSLVASPKITTGVVAMVPWDKMVYMQDMTSYACDSVVIGTTKTLTDIRSNNTDYTIAKLSDGKCWMTQNLRLSINTVKSGINFLTTFTTNLPESYNGIGGSYQVPYTPTFSATDPTNGQIKPATDNVYGAYYSYNAATAGTMNGKTGTAQYDICPKGWRLPTGGSSGEFQALYNRWTTATWTTNNGKNGRWLGAANTASGGAFFPAAGLVSTSEPASAGSVGGYWSSLAYKTSNAYYLYFYQFDINPSSSNEDYRYIGYPIRCIAK